METAPIYLPAEQIVHRAYLRHQRHEQRIDNALCAMLILAGLFCLSFFVAACVTVGWLIAQAAS